ncbi:hypothetical protein KBD87_03685 [Candidatus Saccharibacteria bacterium]|nr:hypothetical protein [Candidatus Saccharibacteria bacterium]
MSQLIDIVKRQGQRPTERFSRNKLHASIRAACLSVQSPEGEAETAATAVSEAVVLWCSVRPEVTSNDLRRVAAHHLHKFHPDAAYMYKHHVSVL